MRGKVAPMSSAGTNANANAVNATAHRPSPSTGTRNSSTAWVSLPKPQAAPSAYTPMPSSTNHNPLTNRWATQAPTPIPIRKLVRMAALTWNMSPRWAVNSRD